MLIKDLKPLNVAIALLTVGLNPIAQAANLGGEAERWSSEEFVVQPENYELSPEASRLLAQELLEILEEYQIILDELDPQLSAESEFIRISLAASAADSETATYFQDLLNTLRNLNISASGSTDEAYVPTLPQVEYSEIFKDIYDFETQSSPLNQNQASIELRQPDIQTSAYSRRFRLQPPKTPSFLHQDSRPERDFFSFELSNFGQPVVNINLAEQPQIEFLLALNSYSRNVTDIPPLPGEFGGLSIVVELPRLPQEKLPKQVYRKYFAEDSEIQQELQQQAQAQSRAQQKHLRRLQKAQ